MNFDCYRKLMTPYNSFGGLYETVTKKHLFDITDSHDGNGTRRPPWQDVT